MAREEGKPKVEEKTFDKTGKTDVLNDDELKGIVGGEGMSDGKI
jgi:hypothetical protein